MSMYAIVFDFDHDVLEKVSPNVSWHDAHMIIREYLTNKGFTVGKFGIYYGDSSVSAVRCVLIVQRFSKMHDWFKPSVFGLRMLKIQDNDDLMQAL